MRDPRIIDKNVEAAELLNSVMDNALHSSAVANICVHGDGAIADLFGYALCRIAAHIDRDDLGAFFREGVCNAFTKAAAGAGDDGDFAVEPHIGLLFVRQSSAAF
jgi:hypothetical protein